MVRPDDHIKEDINSAYVAAVVAQAGYTCHFIGRGDYGTDATIHEIQEHDDGTFSEIGFQFSVQLKAAQAYKQNADETFYEMKASAYNRMARHCNGPMFLILFCTPPDPHTRLHVSEDFLRMHKCCYWYDRPITITKNTSSVTLKIPRTQLFTPEACQGLMERVREGDWE